ncbi:MAG TPA: DUF2993 domain-containing protein [Mycobacteriales bacterium]|jgi:hypothetical protein|nr:DUF2993 domain-containing protein [Mycobacteriales bacterium]
MTDRAPAPYAGPTRRRRWPWVLLTIVVVFAIAFVVTDRLTVGVADDKVATAVADASSQYDVGSGAVDVDIHGFPFLTQALRGSFGRVDVTMRNVKVEEFTIRRLKAKLHDVDVPRSVITSGEAHNVTAARVNVTGEVDPRELSSALNVSGLKFGPAANGIRVTGPVALAGLAGDVDAVLRPRLNGNRLSFEVQSLAIDGATPSGRVSKLVETYLAGGVLLPKLPFDVQITDVSAKDGMVQVMGSGRGVTLVS